MKTTVLLSFSLLFFFGYASTAFAQGFVPLAPIPGLTDIQPTSGGLATFFNNLYKFLIGAAAVLAVIEIIWGGLEIATNKDNVSKITDAKGRIVQAIFGLVLVLSPALVFSIINPNILNLSLNLPALDTKSKSGGVGGGGAVQPKTAPNYDMRYLACGTDCSEARKACFYGPANGIRAGIVCLKEDGTRDPNGRADSSWNPFSSPSCITGQTLSVACDPRP